MKEGSLYIDISYNGDEIYINNILVTNEQASIIKEKIIDIVNDCKSESRR